MGIFDATQARTGQARTGQAPAGGVTPGAMAHPRRRRRSRLGRLLVAMAICPVLVGALRGMSWPGPLGVVVPSGRHVPQAIERWRGEGFEPVVVALSPYEEEDPAAVRRAAEGLGRSGLVVLDCMGFRRKTRDEFRELTGAPVLLANLLVARVIAELSGR